MLGQTILHLVPCSGQAEISNLITCTRETLLEPFKAHPYCHYHITQIECSRSLTSKLQGFHLTFTSAHEAVSKATYTQSLFQTPLKLHNLQHTEIQQKIQHKVSAPNTTEASQAPTHRDPIFLCTKVMETLHQLNEELHTCRRCGSQPHVALIPLESVCGDGAILE